MKALVLLFGLAPALAVAAAPVTAAFDAESYALGYEVYLNNRNVAAAFRLAEAAVRQRPHDLDWRRRLARVAEWHGRPDLALANWLLVAQRSGDPVAWEAVGRLAPALGGAEAQLAYETWQATQHPGDRTRLEKLLAAYEQVGRPEDGLALLAGLIARQPTRALYEAQAGLAERSGDSDTALAALAALSRHYPPEEDWLVRAARLRYQRGEADAAWRGLAAAAPEMPAGALRFWRAYADLSFLLGHAEAAQAAYGHVVAGGRYSESDLDRYASLLGRAQPAAAARLNALLFQRFGRADAAAQALYLWQRAHDLAAAEAFLRGLRPAQRQQLERLPEFIESRGDLRLAQGRWQEALTDYNAGLALTPDQRPLRQSWLELMMEHGHPAALRRLLLEGAPAVRGQPGLARLWAAGWQRLDEPKYALPYLRMAYEQAPDSGLAALRYADGLAQAGFPDQARALQARLWQRRQALLAGAADGNRQALEQALLSLEFERLPPAERERRLRALLARQARSSGHQNPPGPWLREQLLAQGQAEAEADQSYERLAWLVGRLPGPPPAWSQATLALASNDRRTLARLLDTQRQELPPGQQVDIADRLGRPAEAAALAFAGAELHPQDEGLQQTFAEQAVATAGSVGLGAQYDKLDGLVRHPLSLDWQGRQHEHWRPGVYLESAPLDSTSADLALPGSDQRYAELGLGWRGPAQEWQGRLTWLDSLDAQAGLALQGRWPLTGTLRGEVHLGWRQRSLATAGLALAGRRDYAGLTLDWTLSADDSLQLDLEHDRYSAQGGGALGRSTGAGLGYTRQLPAAAGGWALTAGVVSSGAQTAATLPAALQPLVPAGTGADWFVPEDYTQFRLGLAMGGMRDEAYQPVWRAFGEAAVTRDDRGAGYDYRVGLLGPVLGRDRLRLFAQGGEGAPRNGEVGLTLGLDYRLLY